MGHFTGVHVPNNVLIVKYIKLINNVVTISIQHTSEVYVIRGNIKIQYAATI